MSKSVRKEISVRDYIAEQLKKSIPKFDQILRHLCTKGEAFMWLDRLKELKAQTKMSNKQIAEKALTSEKTINRIFTGENPNPYYDTLDRMAKAMGSSMEYLCSDSKIVVGTENLATLQENVDALTADRDVIIAEKDVVVAENAILKDKVSALTAEVDLLKMQLKHKEEIIAIHNYYIKMKSSEQ